MVLLDPRDLPRLDADALSRRHHSQPAGFRARILPGTDPPRRRQRDRLHHLLCRRLRLRSRSLLSRTPAQHEGRLAVVRAHGDRHAPRGRGHSLRQSERALHFLSAAARASGFLHWPRARRGRLVDRILQLDAGLFRLDARTSRRKSPARRRRHFRHLHRLADRDHSRRDRNHLSAHPMVVRLDRDRQCPAGAVALLVLRAPARLLLAAPDLRHVLHDAAEARGRKIVLRFCRPAHLHVAGALLRAGRHSSSIHRAGNQQHVEVRARLLHHAGGGAEFRDRVHHGRFDGARRAGEGRPRLDGLVEETSLSRQGPLVIPVFLLRPRHLHLRRSHRHHQRLLQSRTMSCTTPPGCRRISIKPSPARSSSPTSA